VYTPNADFTGSDSFTYRVRDAAGATATAVVRVGVGQFPAGAEPDAIAPVLQAEPSAPDMSSDGRFVVFESGATLVAGDTNGVADVYLHDRLTGAIERISVSSTGAEANRRCGGARISGNGRFVVFDSDADTLVAGDDNDVWDVFLHDRVDGSTRRVSVTSSGGEANGESFAADLSDDGNVIVFESLAFNLVAGDANGRYDIFSHDRITGQTRRVSTTSSGGEADGSSDFPVISGDGTAVAFMSDATNLVAGDTNGSVDVFLRDLATGQIERVSVSSTGIQGDGDSGWPSISSSGRFVAFQTTATNLAANATGSAIKALVRDRQPGQSPTTILVAQPITGDVDSVAISGDGRYAVTAVRGSVIVRDRFGSNVHTFPGVLGGSIHSPALSTNGRYLVVLSRQALDPQEPTTGEQVFVLANPL
jgi:Tol biopolymer transport system component